MNRWVLQVTLPGEPVRCPQEDVSCPTNWTDDHFNNLKLDVCSDQNQTFSVVYCETKDVLY